MDTYKQSYYHGDSFGIDSEADQIQLIMSCLRMRNALAKQSQLDFVRGVIFKSDNMLSLPLGF